MDFLAENTVLSLVERKADSLIREKQNSILIGDERINFLSIKNKDKIFHRNLDILYPKFTKK